MDDEPFIEALERIARELRSNTLEEHINGIRNPPMSWLALRDMDFNYDWLVEKFWPVGTHLHIFASPKTGKSLLMLWVAASLAIGKDPFSHDSIKQHRVSYIDNEMTLKDVHDRTMDMGFDFEQLEGWLQYHPYPLLAPMDTEQGGWDTLQLMIDDDSSVLVIDTLSRVVKGEENSNDTYRNFYNHTGRLLRSHEISLARLDHAGHDPKKSRGASAKADDVDLVYGLERRSDKDESPGFKLTRTHSRVSGVLEFIELALIDNDQQPMSIKRTDVRTWSQGAIRKAKELESLGIPIEVSVREAQRLMKVAGTVAGKSIVLQEAIRLRKYSDPINNFLR